MGCGKSILSKNTKLAVIAETMSYAFENANEGNKEMEEEIIAQLKEGDILGAVFDGAEGFVDNIIGGSIEVLGDVVGGTVDDKLGKMRVVKHINDFAEYGTGLLGWNEGDGYSVGGLIGGAAEKISDGIDVATDFVTDVTDVVTDTVTGGIKTGVKWVTSWFD